MAGALPLAVGVCSTRAEVPISYPERAASAFEFLCVGCGGEGGATRFDAQSADAVRRSAPIDPWRIENDAYCLPEPAKDPVEP